MAYFLPSLLPQLADQLWFPVDRKLDEDCLLTKEEDAYLEKVLLLPKNYED